MNKYITEFLGTFFLVLTIGCSVAQGIALTPLAIGSCLMVVIFMGGHISGAHYNPAVSVAAWLRGRLAAKDLGYYIAAQILGGLAAAFIASFITGKTIPVAPGADYSTMQWLVVEFLFTFLLATVVLNVATSKDHPTNSFYGLAIGFTVTVGAIAVGPISGGAFNPAVAISLNVLNGSFGHIALYVVSTIAGGAVAGLFFKVMNPDDA